MALLFMEGFGGGDTLQLKWDPTTTQNFTVGSASPRVPGCYYGITPASVTSYHKSFTASSNVILGLGNYMPVNGASNYSFYGDSGATQHITVFRNGSGFVEVRRGNTGGTLLATGTTQIAASSWFYIEISVTISDTVGEVHVRLNGQPTDEISYTGDTKNGGTNTTIDRITYTNGTNAASSQVADLYILNSTGTTNNTFLGDVAVRTLSPNGNGTYSQLTNSAGNSVNNYSYVNEHPYSSAQYTGSQTPGLRDTYTLADLPAGVTNVYGVQVVGYMAKSDAGAGQSRLALLSGGSLYYGATRALTTSYVSYYDLYESDPATSLTWTVGGVNSLEAGMEVA